MLRTAFTILYMNLTKPFKLRCQQKESQQIVNMDSELNNTLNKTNIDVNDLIYSGLDTIILPTMKSEERQLYSQV